VEARRRAFQELLSRRERIYVMRTAHRRRQPLRTLTDRHLYLGRGLHRDDALASAYKDCLNAA
jgi:hypothetical protein